MGVNDGPNKVRFPPGSGGSRIRAGVELLELMRGPRGAHSTGRVTIEREGGDKPACSPRPHGSGRLACPPWKVKAAARMPAGTMSDTDVPKRDRTATSTRLRARDHS